MTLTEAGRSTASTVTEAGPSTGQVVTEALSGLAPICLAELTERAALQTRYDRKYVLPVAQVGTLLSRLEPDTRVLEIDDVRNFRYQSIYFDTADLTSFRLAAMRRRRRFKIRTRSYLDSAACWLEVKTEGSRGGTVKNRLPYQPHDARTIDPGRSFVDEMLTALAVRDCGGLAFSPTIAIWYRRSTLYLPATGSRVTIDVDLTWADRDGRCLSLPDVAVVETKTGSVASYADRLLWSHRSRPISISKYATCLATLRPDLPATPWRRTLRRYFEGAIPATAPAATG